MSGFLKVGWKPSCRWRRPSARRRNGGSPKTRTLAARGRYLGHELVDHFGLGLKQSQRRRDRRGSCLPVGEGDRRRDIAHRRAVEGRADPAGSLGWQRTCRTPTGTTTRRFTTRSCVSVRPRPGLSWTSGCGDGLLLGRLARTGRPAVGVEPDPVAAALARRRYAGVSNAAVVEHTGSLESSRRHARCGRRALRAGPHQDRHAPRPRLRHQIAASCPNRRRPARRAVAGHSAGRRPLHTIEEVRRDVEAVLVGARLHRRRYYRFSLEWTKPPN